MYNYQQHSRRLMLQAQCKNIQNQYVKLNQLRKKNNLKMSLSRSRRVDAFMLSCVETPVKVDVYKPPDYQPRKVKVNLEALPKHKLPFRMNSHTDFERIQDITRKDCELDSVPFHNASLHKFRDLASSTATKPFRIRPACGAFKVYQTLLMNRSNEVQFKYNQKMDKMFRSSCCLSNRNQSLQNFQRSLAPTLHHKTYFNSLKTFMNSEAENSGADNRKNENDTHHEKYEHEGEKQNKKNKQNAVEHLNRHKNAVDALTKSGLIQQHKN